MEPVTSLTEYIDMVCTQGDAYQTSIVDESFEVARSNEVVKELLVWKDKESPESFDDFLRANTRYIYSYKHRKECTPKLESRSRSHYELFYRGVNSSTYLIAPGIYRRNEYHDESFYYHEMSVRCPEVFRTFSNLEKLAYMQHYGCPTRLLDITSNPLVALYFACCGSAKESDGVVYVFAVPTEEVLYENSDRILILSHLAEYRKEQQEEMDAVRKAIPALCDHAVVFRDVNDHVIITFSPYALLKPGKYEIDSMNGVGADVEAEVMEYSIYGYGTRTVVIKPYY